MNLLLKKISKKRLCFSLIKIRSIDVKDPIEIVTLSNKAVFVRFGKSSANEMILHEVYDDIFYSLDDNNELALLNIFDFSPLEEFLRSNSN